MLKYFDNLPIFFVFLAFFGFFIVLTLLFYRWFYRLFYAKATMNDRQTRVISTLTIVGGSFYGILFGLVLVNLWQNFHTVQMVVGKEASDLSAVLIDSQALPLPIRTSIETNIKKYIDQVRRNEWHHMQEATSGSETWVAFWNIFNVIKAYAPTTPLETTYYAQMLNKFHDVLQDRNERFDKLATEAVPTIIFFVIFIGAVLTIASMALITLIAGNYLLFLNLAIDCYLALSLCIAFDLHSVFQGVLSISDKPFDQGILYQLNHGKSLAPLIPSPVPSEPSRPLATTAKVFHSAAKKTQAKYHPKQVVRVYGHPVLRIIRREPPIFIDGP